MLKNYFIIFLAAYFGGFCFSIMHFPLPWTLGPLVTVIILKIALKRKVRWPVRVRNIAMLFLGYAMGSSFTPQAGQYILAQLPAMIILTLLSITLCLLGGQAIRQYTGVSFATAVLGSMPGGLTQMAIVCEDVKDADPAAVTLMQTVRIVTVVFIVPLLVLHGLADRVDPINRTAVAMTSGEFPVLLLFVGVIVVLMYFAKLIKLPNSYLIVPVIGAAGLAVTGVHAPVLPPLVIAVAQVCVGIRMGMAINVGSLTNWKKLVIYNFISVLMVIVALLGVDYVFSRLTGIGFVTAFISNAPGGITEMGLTAMMVHADLATVVSFQMFRLMFVLVVSVPAIRWWLRRKQADAGAAKPKSKQFPGYTNGL